MKNKNEKKERERERERKFVPVVSSKVKGTDHAICTLIDSDWYVSCTFGYGEWI
jgi:hypothetical protein